MEKYALVIVSLETDHPELDEVPVPRCLREPSFNFPFIGPSLMLEMVDARWFVESEDLDPARINIVWTDIVYDDDDPHLYEQLEGLVDDINGMGEFLTPANYRWLVRHVAGIETWPEIRPYSTVAEWVRPAFPPRRVNDQGIRTVVDRPSGYRNDPVPVG